MGCCLCPDAWKFGLVLWSWGLLCDSWLYIVFWLYTWSCFFLQWRWMFGVWCCANSWSAIFGFVLFCSSGVQFLAFIFSAGWCVEWLKRVPCWCFFSTFCAWMVCFLAQPLLLSLAIWNNFGFFAFPLLLDYMGSSSTSFLIHWGAFKIMEFLSCWLSMLGTTKNICTYF